MPYKIRESLGSIKRLRWSGFSDRRISTTNEVKLHEHNPASRNTSTNESSRKEALGGAATTLPGIIATGIPTPDGVIQIRETIAAQSPGMGTETNPHLVGINTGQDIWGGLKAFAIALGTCGAQFAPLRSAINTFAEFAEAFKVAGEMEEEYELLRRTLDWLFRDLAFRFGKKTPPTMRPSISNLTRGLEREIEFINNKRQHFLGQYLQSGKNVDDIIRCYRRIENLLQRLNLNANMDIWLLVEEQVTGDRLKSLSPSHAAWYSSKESSEIYRDECTADTRLEVLEKFKVWREDDTTEQIYWLNGMAGTGKTTLAYTLCKQLENEDRLAANFFCSRLLASCRDANLILPTIAYQLAQYSFPFRYALSQVLQVYPDVHTRRTADQFEKLLVLPLREVESSFPQNAIILIEALDECRNAAIVGQILELLLTRITDLPIKFFLTSRPEPEIARRMFPESGECKRIVLHLHNIDKSIVQGDIRRYLEAGLKPANVSTEHMDVLVTNSGVLFIYAATIVRYVSDFGFARSSYRLNQVLGVSKSPNGSDGAINELYNLVLDQAVHDPRLGPEEQEEVLCIIHTVICAQEPMAISTLSTILGLSEQTVNAAISSVRSVLNMQYSNEGITTLHKSFSDYMFDQNRSNAFYCDEAKHHQLIAQGCFYAIESFKPWFNICNLTTSSILDKDIPNISAKVNEHISDALLYVCRYWGVHLQRSSNPLDLFESIHVFISRQLLFWVEVLNLTRHLSNGPTKMLADVTSLIKESIPDQQTSTLLELATDARDFVHAYASSPVSQSTPHVYISALQCWPTEKLISKCYSPYFRRFMFDQVDPKPMCKLNRQLPIYETIGGIRCSATLALLARTDMGAIFSSCYSPDGAYLVSGSDNHTVRIWDAQTGHPVGDPLEGHTSCVRSVSYSADGAYIVSGSDDRTVRIWDAQTGHPVGKPLEGHTSRVRSVSYSADGAYIVSGSDDRTVQIWDARTGQPVGKPLEGHASSVLSASYSPNGVHIVSGSHDRNVRIWDARAGQQVGRLLKGHKSSVYSVSYSPDGTCIVSGSADKTVRIWDAHTGEQVGEPLTGHTLSIRSVAYSPDGVHVISGSQDHTIRIWDARAGHQVGEPLRGHKSSVNSVSYSPDGGRIVSGSDDETIRVWQSQTNQLVLIPLPCQSTHLVKWMPDDSLLRSSSLRQAVRAWDSANNWIVRPHSTTHTIPASQQSVTELCNEWFETGLVHNSLESVCFACRGKRKDFAGNFFIKDAVLFDSKSAGASETELQESLTNGSPKVPSTSCPSISSEQADYSQLTLCTWAFDEDGWIVTCASQYLLWLPPHVRKRIQYPLDSPYVPPENTLRIDLEADPIGNRWAEVFLDPVA
ncbi:Vegetative incompatibility protein HET-E-1 [Ceratobasidium sp. AG-Ba]|nr:Vegetative incompatibility protein HET-E-1 [Ceratobasidium sp. AG-Ba]